MAGDRSAEAILQSLMQDICLRRKKDMKFVDLKLPKKTEYLHRIQFLPEEKTKYDALLYVSPYFFLGPESLWLEDLILTCQQIRSKGRTRRVPSKVANRSERPLPERPGAPSSTPTIVSDRLIARLVTQINLV